MESGEACELFDDQFGSIASAELVQRLLLYIECAGVMKQQMDSGALADPDDVLEYCDFLDDYLQLFLQQARDEQSALGDAVYQRFTQPRMERFLNTWADRRQEQRRNE